ncbi:60S ribosomal protein L6 [Exidia glandulosa HHB12029]|uniref:60S ribosomal protein L6 n=1 Tax=Exidia glandulosa HHB12029 TaxID=1314781 RepID=A0A165QL37_EXIGL|nr:60S ribosomal protein L6 [Exidia glandulosa HHB12029]
MAKELVPGVGRLSRSAAYSKRQLYKGRKTGAPKAAEDVPAFKEVEVKGDKNGSTRRVPTAKAARFYPAEDVRKPKVSRKTAKPTKLRSAITPGTVLILLAGRFRGKRVVFLKQLDSGLLLVTGPYKVNGVPLRRVNQAYVIATSTKVDIPELSLSDKINDAFFAKENKGSRASAEEEFFANGKPVAKEPLPEAKTSEQKAVDAAVLAGVKKAANLEKYLKASWGLSKGQFPHQLVF